MSPSVMRGLRSTLGFVDFELLDAAVLGVVERLASRRLGRCAFALELRPPGRKLGAVQR